MLLPIWHLRRLEPRHLQHLICGHIPSTTTDPEAACLSASLAQGAADINAKGGIFLAAADVYGNRNVSWVNALHVNFSEGSQSQSFGSFIFRQPTADLQPASGPRPLTA